MIITITIFWLIILWSVSQVQNLDDVGMDLLRKMLVYDPMKRISAKDARRHRYFRDVRLPPGLPAPAPAPVRLETREVVATQ